MMLLKQMKYFVSIVENNSFTEAAEKYFVSQSAISQQIKSLEMELGVELILRGNRSFTLTSAGEYFYRQSLIILDEPTAALDPIAESELYQEYNEIAENRTAIFISHRLATTKFCSKIILMEKGKIADIGSHDDLMENNEIYREMYINQSKHYKETSAV